MLHSCLVFVFLYTCNKLLKYYSAFGSFKRLCADYLHINEFRVDVYLFT